MQGHRDKNLRFVFISGAHFIALMTHKKITSVSNNFLKVFGSKVVLQMSSLWLPEISNPNCCPQQLNSAGNDGACGYGSKSQTIGEQKTQTEECDKAVVTRSLLSEVYYFSTWMRQDICSTCCSERQRNLILVPFHHLVSPPNISPL